MRARRGLARRHQDQSEGSQRGAASPLEPPVRSRWLGHRRKAAHGGAVSPRGATGQVSMAWARDKVMKRMNDNYREVATTTEESRWSRAEERDDEHGDDRQK